MKPRCRWCSVSAWRWRESARLVFSRAQASATIVGALAVVADERDEPALVLRAGHRLADVVKERAEAQRVAPRELVGERLGEQRADVVGGRRPRSGRGRTRPRAGWRAPRACGRGRRGGGSGSGRRRAARSSSGSTAGGRAELVQQREPAQRVGAGEQQPQLGELALARGLAGAAGGLASERARSRRRARSRARRRAARRAGSAAGRRRSERSETGAQQARASRSATPPVGSIGSPAGRRAQRRSR